MRGVLFENHLPSSIPLVRYESIQALKSKMVYLESQRIEDAVLGGGPLPPHLLTPCLVFFL